MQRLIHQRPQQPLHILVSLCQHAHPQFSAIDPKNAHLVMLRQVVEHRSTLVLEVEDGVTPLVQGWVGGEEMLDESIIGTASKTPVGAELGQQVGCRYRLSLVVGGGGGGGIGGVRVRSGGHGARVGMGGCRLLMVGVRCVYC